MEKKDVERFQHTLDVIIDGYNSKISELEAKINELESEVDNLKSQNKVLKINNKNLKSHVIDYEIEVNCLTRILEENGVILKDTSK